MAKPRFAMYGEYIIQIIKTGQVSISRFYNNTIGVLREIAELKGFEYDPKWNTRHFGRKLIEEFGEGDRATVGEYTIVRKSDDSIEVYKDYDNKMGAIREIAEKCGFELDPKWNTQDSGRKLSEFLESLN